MDWLKAVIARLLGRPTRQVSPTVSPTQPAGPVCPEPTTPTGNPSFAQPTSPQRQSRPHPQPAKPAVKPKRKAASQTKAGVKRTRAKAPAQTRTARRSGGSGN